MAINVPLNAQLQNATQLQQQIQNAVNAVRINLGGPNGARALSSLSQPLGRLTGQADEFTKSLDAANARVLAFGASVGVVNAVSNAFKSLVQSTIEVEKAITAISVVGDQFSGKTKELSQGLFNVAKVTGQSFNDVSKAALEFSRQGLSLEDTLSRTQDALVLTRLTGLDAAKAVDGLTASVNGFSKAGLSTTQILNKLAAVDQAFAVSAADLIEGFNRSAAVAQNAGVSFDELAGIITALQQETSRGGAVIGNALKTIFTRLQDTSTLNQLQNLGVAVQDLQGNILPARQILQNLAKDVEGLGQITKAGIFKDVAGTFQINQLIALVSDLNKENSIAAAATRKAAGATNEAFVANEKLNQSLDAILNKVATTGKQLGSLLGEIGLSDNLKGILDGLNSFLESANSLLQGDDIGSNFAKGFVKGIGAVLSGPGLGVFLAIIAKLSFDLLKFGAQSLKTFFGIGKAAADQKQIQESIVQTLLRNQNVLNTILNTQGGQNAQALKFLGILNQQASAMQLIQGLAGGIAGTVYSAGYRQTGQGLQRRSAGGYLPAQEAADVRRGVGGASPSSKVVAIPNFAFGGGKRGTMIANTSEYIVPNYAGGGSAIFNQDMVKAMGLPPGAKKISAAGGFIPNFADTSPLDVSRKYALIVNKAISPRIGETISYKPKGGERVSYKANIYGIDVNKIKNNKAFEKYFSSQGLVKKYTDLAIKDAKNYSEAVIGQPISPVSINKLSNAGSIPSLVGSIFESGISAAIQDPQLIQAQLERSPNAPFDFIDVPKLNEFFGIPQGVRFIEAKYDASNDALNSFASKIFKNESGITDALKQRVQKLASGRRLEIRSDDDIKKLQTTLAQSGSFNFRVTGTKVSPNTIQAFKNAGGIQVNSSSGYIPNFASSALQQAIAREKSAGLSDSQIYVDQSAALKSPMNPMGLMVANRRDEPAGGFQGIARARKEGMNPKLYGAAGGFVPNYAISGGVDPLIPISNLPTTPDPKKIEDVNKGFADTAGKIFLLQSALSFLQGAVGDTEDSFSKITNAFASASGNITSLALLGKEISSIKIDGAGLAANLGKIGKSLGIAGVAFGAVTEGIKFADFAIKEFSGANKRAADALAGLETAAQGALVSLNDLTPAGQRIAQETGKAALESFSGSFLSNLFTQAAGKNPEIQKNVGSLAAQGIKLENFKSDLETSTLNITAQRKGYKSVNDYLEKNAKNIFGGTNNEIKEMWTKELIRSVEVADIGEAIQNLFKSEEVQKASGALATVREKFKGGEFGAETNINKVKEIIPEAKDVDPKILQSIIDANKLTLSTKKAIVEEERNQALGERITIELAKQKLDNLIEQKKNTIDLNTLNGTEGLRFQLQALDLSESYRNELEKQIKLKEIDGELSKKNIDLVKSSIDKLSSLPSESALGISVKQVQELQSQLGNLDITTVDQLNQAIENIGGTLGLNKDQIARINALYAEQFNQLNNNADAEKRAAINAADFNAKVIDTKNSLQAARLLTEQIANDLERAAGVRLSFAEVGISATENRAKLLRARAGAATTNVEKRGLESEAIRADQLANEQRRISSEEQYNSDQKRLELLKNQAQADFLRKSSEFSKGQITFEQLTEAGDAFKKADADLIKLNNTQQIARQNFALTSQELQMQAEAIYRVVGANDALKNSLDQFKLGAGERIGAAMFEQLGATDINSLMQSRIKQNVETDALGIENDQDRYKFVQEQTRLRQIQFDLATAESAVRRRELEYELKYTQEIIDLKNQGASDQELIDARNRQILEQRSGRRGFEKGLDTIQERIDNYRSTLGEEIPNLFSSNLAQGLNDAISGAKSLKEALSDAATSFFQEITRRNISNLADLVTGGLGKGVSSGGGIFSSILSFFGGGNKTGVTAAASGGMIKGGSGTKDDVPAMLMGGEYVVKKSAVNKYGKGFLDALNNGKMRGYATGGLVDPQTFPTQTGRGGFFTPGDYGQGAITGKNELLTFASQSFTGGQYDYMGGFGMGGATVSLEPESARLSALGREGSPMFERVQQSKDEAFKVYLEGLQKEKEYADLLDQIAKDKKARKKALQTAIVSAVVTSALNYAGTRGQIGAKNQIAATAGTSKLSGFSKFTTGLSGFGRGILHLLEIN